MEELLLIIIFFLFGFISSIDIDIKGMEGTYSLTSGEAYNFYVQVERMVQISVDFTFKNLSYVPFDCIHINEYSSRNGRSLRNYTIEDFGYPTPREDRRCFFYYDMDNFSSTYFSFSFKSNSTVEKMDIKIIFFGGVTYLDKGITEEFDDVYYDIPWYFVIPVSNSKIEVELISRYDDDLENLNLTLIEYQKNNSDYYINLKQYFTNYKIISIKEDDEKIISFNYIIKNINTNIFCIKLGLENDISHLKVTLNEERYYYTLYDKYSLDILDLKSEQAYHISLETKNNNLFIINYVIQPQYTGIPLESMIIYEDKAEFSPDHLSKFVHNINELSESFSYLISESETKYLSLNIEPHSKIKKFSISYNMTKQEIIENNLKNNSLFRLSRLNPYSIYKFNINSKILEKLEYEITIKYSDITPRPFDNISLIENPSKFSKIDILYFKKVGNYLQASSSFIITHCDTKNSTFLIKPNNNAEYFSIKVNVIGDNFYYLNKEVKKNIKFLLPKKEYYFAINIDKTLSNVLIYIYIKYKINSEFYIYSIDYYRESNNEFQLKYGQSLSPKYDHNGNEYNSTVKLDYTSQFNPYMNFDVLLLKIVIGSNDNYDDFNIEYKYVDKKYDNVPTEKNNTWVYIVCSIGAVLAIVSIGTSAKFGCKKKSNSNLIEDNIDADANLMPLENQENQETNEHQDENK